MLWDPSLGRVSAALQVHVVMSTIAKDILNLMIFQCVNISKVVATDVTLLCSFIFSCEKIYM